MPAPPPERAGAVAENARAAGFMVLSMAGFASNDAMMKSVSDTLPLFQAVFIRGLLATFLIGVYAWWRGTLARRTGPRDRRLLSLRAIGEIGGTACFLTALFNMPIANASAILQSLPLAMTLAAAVFFGEPVGWRRYLAIAIGFAGVLIIVRPGAAGFNAWGLFAVAAIGFIVMRDLSTRRLSPDVPGLAAVFFASAALTGTAGIACLFGDWVTPPPGDVALLAFASLCIIVGYVFGVLAMRQGEIGFVQPFRYTLLLWAIVYGIVLFGEWPDAATILGSAVVVATGLFTFYRERRLAYGEGKP